MPRINFPYTTAFTTVTTNEIENLLSRPAYLVEGRIDEENLYRYNSSNYTGLIPTKRFADWADESNPVSDCMKFFSTDVSETAYTSVKSNIFDPLKTMMDANKQYVVGSGQVAWNFTKDTSPDKVRKEKVMTSRGKKLLGGLTGAGAAAGAAGGIAAAATVVAPLSALAATLLIGGVTAGSAGVGALLGSALGLYKTVLRRETSIYKKTITIEKPVYWIPARQENTDEDIDNIFNVWDDKIRWTATYRIDKLVDASNNDPKPFDIVINGPIVKPEEVEFEVEVLCAALLDKEYVNIEVNIECLFEIMP